MEYFTNAFREEGVFYFLKINFIRFYSESVAASVNCKILSRNNMWPGSSSVSKSFRVRFREIGSVVIN